MFRPRPAHQTRSTALQLCRITWCLGLFACRCILAQDSTPGIRMLHMNLTGSFRSRIESWDWFQAAPEQNSYTYGAAVLRLALGQSSTRLRWQVEGALPVFVNL